MAQNKTKISITLDSDLIERYKKVAEIRQENLSSFINRQLTNRIDELEEYVELMESPVYRAIARGISRSPKILKTIAGMLGEDMPQEIAEEQARLHQEQASMGKKRQQAKKEQSKHKTGKVEPA